MSRMFRYLGYTIFVGDFLSLGILLYFFSLIKHIAVPLHYLETIIEFIVYPILCFWCLSMLYFILDLTLQRYQLQK